MTGKRKKKKALVRNDSLPEGEKKLEIPKIIQLTEKDATGSDAKPELIDILPSKKMDTLGESVSELFSRVAKLEEMLDVLTSSAPIEPTVTEPETEIDMRDYVVREGQTMSMIAKEVYGNAGLFNRIAAHNYDRYPELRENANEVKEGWRLRIPPAP